jgi:hypothetical protein
MVKQKSGLKHYNLKIVVWSMAIWSDEHRRRKWWVMIQMAERLYSTHGEQLGTI